MKVNILLSFVSDSSMLNRQSCSIFVDNVTIHQHEEEDLKNIPGEDVDDHDASVADLQKLSLKLPSARMRCKSPVTVQEWVAALPDLHEEEEIGLKEDTRGEIGHHLDTLSLGAEGIYCNVPF